MPFASRHEGFMHACGHDIHMAVALGLLEQLLEHPLDNDVVILFQPAEEGRAAHSRFFNGSKRASGSLPDELFALHIAPELPVGTVATKPGLLFANTSELFIDLHGKGGHAAYPHQTRDMAVAAAALLMQLQTVVSRNVDPMDSAVLTVGKMSAGTVQNIIAERARLEGTIRTLTPESMESVKNASNRCAGRSKKAMNAKCRSIMERTIAKWTMTNSLLSRFALCTGCSGHTGCPQQSRHDG
ncbi:amidohydrolase [Planococcus sp. MB-3u-03]|uniref:amidohydrolase n=1 Tax=Planococcus sp. MB-3u-03 TaxID=2058136 RepID=UPI001E540153|nr:amidohydrolase [Planococcus sp. MB-3u-03]